MSLGPGDRLTIQIGDVHECEAGLVRQRGCVLAILGGLDTRQNVADDGAHEVGAARQEGCQTVGIFLTQEPLVRGSTGGKEPVQNHDTRAHHIVGRECAVLGDVTDEGRVAPTVLAMGAELEEGGVLLGADVGLMGRLLEDIQEVAEDAVELHG